MTMQASQHSAHPILHPPGMMTSSTYQKSALQPMKTARLWRGLLQVMVSERRCMTSGCRPSPPCCPPLMIDVHRAPSPSPLGAHARSSIRRSQVGSALTPPRLVIWRRLDRGLPPYTSQRAHGPGTAPRTLPASPTTTCTHTGSMDISIP